MPSATNVMWNIRIFISVLPSCVNSSGQTGRMARHKNTNCQKQNQHGWWYELSHLRPGWSSRLHLSLVSILVFHWKKRWDGDNIRWKRYCRPLVPYYSQISVVAQRQISAVLANKVAPREALADADREIAAMLSRYELEWGIKGVRRKA